MDEEFMAKLFAVLAMLIAIVWLVGYLAPIWQPNYKPPPELNVVMMAIVGVFATLWQKARHPKDGGDDDDEQ